MVPTLAKPEPETLLPTGICLGQSPHAGLLGKWRKKAASVLSVPKRETPPFAAF